MKVLFALGLAVTACSGNTGNTSNTPDSGAMMSTKSDVGKTCSKNRDCTDVCLFKGSADFGYCSKACESFTDCPTFWECNEVGNASGKYCIQK